MKRETKEVQKNSNCDKLGSIDKLGKICLFIWTIVFILLGYIIGRVI